MSESSYKSFEIEEDKLKCLCGGGFDIESANMARQTYPSTYDANGYIDIVRSNMVIQKDLIHGDRVQAFVTDVSYEIDELSDIDFLEYLITKSPELVKRLF